MKPQVLFDAQDMVGKSIIWSAEEKALYWVDFVGRRIHRLEPGNDRHETWETPDFPTSIGLADDGFIVGLTREVCLWRPDEDFTTFAIPEPALPENRLNEGRVAPDGSFWVSTMQNNLEEDGTPKAMDSNCGGIYRIDPSGSVSAQAPHVYGITNTLAWTRDRNLLFADTQANEIYRFGYDQQTKRLTDRKTIVSGFERGLPDGSCIDTDDNLWNCRAAGGASVARFSPDGGLLDLIELPVTWPTSCAFGGDDLSTLYVTSSRFTMSAEHLAANPLEGSLLAIETTARGVAEYRFG